MVDGIVKEHGIQLEVDIPASVRANGLVKLPETHNIRRADGNNLITYERFPLVRYAFQDLFAEYTNVQLPDYSKPEEPKKAIKKRSDCHAISLKPNANHDYTAYALKSIRFMEHLVETRLGNLDGKRELILFYYHNFAIQVYDKETAFQMTAVLNQKFTIPLKESEVRCATKSDKIYQLSFQKLADTLALSETEQQLYHSCTNERKLSREKAKQQKAERNQKIIAMYQEAVSVDEIVQSVHCSKRTVLNVLKELSEQKKIERNQKIVVLRQQGLSQQKIADVLHCNRKTVSAVLKDSEVLSVASAKTESQSHASMKKEILKQIFLLWMVVDLYQKLQCPKNAKNAFCQTYQNRIVFGQNDFETCFVPKVQESPAINLLWEVVLIRYVSIRSPADSPDKQIGYVQKMQKSPYYLFYFCCQAVPTVST